MLEFFRYFFGMGDAIEFENFTLPHFLPILHDKPMPVCHV